MKTDLLSKLIGRPVEFGQIPLIMRYPPDLLTREVVKSGLGLAVCLGILIFLKPIVFITWVLAAISAMFAYYLYSQLMRFKVQFALDEEGLSRQAGGPPRRIPWSQMDNLKLHYYSHGRRAKSGTLVLTLYQGKTKVKVDSTLDHFPTLLRTAASGARNKGLDMNPTTMENLEQLQL